jgi:hypothetical protein
MIHQSANASRLPQGRATRTCSCLQCGQGMSLDICRYWTVSSQERDLFFGRFQIGGLCYSSFSTPTRSQASRSPRFLCPRYMQECQHAPFHSSVASVSRFSVEAWVLSVVLQGELHVSVVHLLGPFASSRQQQTPSKWTMTKETKAAHFRTCKRAACMSSGRCIRAGASLAAMTAYLDLVAQRRALG